MGQQSDIGWTDGTWTIVQGCDPLSPGCIACYAVPLLWRMAHNPNEKISGPIRGLTEQHTNRAGKTILRFTGHVALREDRLDWPLKWRKPMMIFVPSHGDLFHKEVPDEFIDRVFTVMEQAGWHKFQVLTKRSRRQRDYVNARYADRGIPPPLHIWFGVSCEDAKRYAERAPDLYETKASVTFFSLEPLIGPINMWDTSEWAEPSKWWGRSFKPSWTIIGGESGKNARPFDIAWARSLIAQCRRSEVPTFVKQLGSNPVLHGFTGMPIMHKKGEDWSEWPEDLRVREFPS